MENNPVPPYNLDGRKAKISPLYDWMSQGHGILVQKHQLNVNAEYLFQNILVHSANHYLVATLHSSNCSLSLVSRLEASLL